jgi:hypothetical protein
MTKNRFFIFLAQLAAFFVITVAAIILMPYFITMVSSGTSKM